MSDQHSIVAEYDVIWTAGEGRLAYALAGGSPDPTFDTRTDLFMDWHCDCGLAGRILADAQAHANAIAELGQSTTTTIRRRGE